MLIAPILAAGAIWSGTARVEVMIWEPGGEHPYTTDFELQYAEGPHTARAGVSASGIGYKVQLVPRRVAIHVHHEVRQTHGSSICKGGGTEIVASPPPGLVAAPDRATTDVGRAGRPAGSRYQLVLPRAVGAFGCGGKVNAGDRWVVIGTALFPVSGDVHAADSETRRLTAGGARMQGEFRASDAGRGAPVRHDYHVTWDLRRRIEP